MNKVKINIGIKSNDIYLYHTNTTIEKDELEMIINDKEIPERYWRDVLDFFEYQMKNKKNQKKITEIIVIYEENGKEKNIYCDKMLEYFE